MIVTFYDVLHLTTGVQRPGRAIIPLDAAHTFYILRVREGEQRKQG